MELAFGGLRRHLGGLKPPQAHAWLRPCKCVFLPYSKSCHKSIIIIVDYQIIIIVIITYRRTDEQ